MVVGAVVAESGGRKSVPSVDEVGISPYPDGWAHYSDVLSNCSGKKGFVGIWVVEIARNAGFDAAPWVVAMPGNPVVDLVGDGPVALCEHNGGVRLGDVPHGALFEGRDCRYALAVDVVPVVGGCDQQPWIG